MVIWGRRKNRYCKQSLCKDLHAVGSKSGLAGDYDTFQKHFESLAPKGVKVLVKPHHGGQAYVTPIDTLEYQAANDAYEESFGKAPIPQRSGGSIPIVSLLKGN